MRGPVPYTSIMHPFLIPRCCTSNSFRTSARDLSGHFMSTHASPTKSNRLSKTTTETLNYIYSKQLKISALTAHDALSGRIAQLSGVDVILVGDSLAMTSLGHTDTLAITLPEMIHHCKAVKRGLIQSADHPSLLQHGATTPQGAPLRVPFLVGDCPFGSTEHSKERALDTALAFLKEGGMDGIKLEGGVEVAETVHFLTTRGIPVLGHIGLTPQRYLALGGYKVQGKTLQQAKQLMKDALALQAAGAWGVVIEAVPSPVAQHITQVMNVPSIGIGSGVGTSGQILVQVDALGYGASRPRFCKVFAEIERACVIGMQSYVAQVQEGSFPGMEHCYGIPGPALAAIDAWAKGKEEEGKPRRDL